MSPSYKYPVTYHWLGEPVTIRQGRKKKERKEKKRKERLHPISLFRFFLVFLHECKILIFIKNNLKNTKNILTIKCYSIEFWTFDLIYHTRLKPKYVSALKTI